MQYLALPSLSLLCRALHPSRHALISRVRSTGVRPAWHGGSNGSASYHLEWMGYLLLSLVGMEYVVLYRCPYILPLSTLWSTSQKVLRHNWSRSPPSEALQNLRLYCGGVEIKLRKWMAWRHPNFTGRNTLPRIELYNVWTWPSLLPYSKSSLSPFSSLRDTKARRPMVGTLISWCLHSSSATVSLL